MGPFVETEIYIREIVEILQSFIESEGKTLLVCGS